MPPLQHEFVPEQLKLFTQFIIERENVRLLRETGAQPPWTSDPILRAFRFTNIRREDDYVTRWYANNWRTPHADDPDAWFASYVCRVVNEPATLERLGYPVPWDEKRFLATLGQPNPGGEPLYRAAYMIRSTSEFKGQSKAAYLAAMQLTPAWEKRSWVRPVLGDSLQSFYTRLTSLYGLGSFLSAQIVADVKFIRPLCDAPDWKSFAASGPGSRRGLNLLRGFPMDAAWSEDEWRLSLNRLIEAVAPTLLAQSIDLSAQDLQNCLCEVSKWLKARNGTGRPKQKYIPAHGGVA
jgi:hypothetical protein